VIEHDAQLATAPRLELSRAGMYAHPSGWEIWLTPTAVGSVDVKEDSTIGRLEIFYIPKVTTPADIQAAIDAKCKFWRSSS
jgi:hypothetical protein